MQTFEPIRCHPIRFSSTWLPPFILSKVFVSVCQRVQRVVNESSRSITRAGGRKKKFPNFSGCVRSGPSIIQRTATTINNPNYYSEQKVTIRIKRCRPVTWSEEASHRVAADWSRLTWWLYFYFDNPKRATWRALSMNGRSRWASVHPATRLFWLGKSDDFQISVALPPPLHPAC